MIPHVTNEIKAACRKVAADVDVAIVEIGGTVGDIESLPFIEAIRQMRHEEGRENTLFVHLTLVPWIAAAQELKTKPTQHSVKELRAVGIQPDILLCRSERPLPDDVKEKIALFCDVDVKRVVTAKDVNRFTRFRLVFAEQGVDETVLRHASCAIGAAQLVPLDRDGERMKNPVREVTIGLVGKYVEYEDSYKSLKEALLHAGIAHQAASTSSGSSRSRWSGRSAASTCARFDGILVPGGFGKRGIRGMLNAIRCAREEKIPYFGICLGMQTMVIEFARNVCGLADADSTEFNAATPHRVIYKLRELKGVDELGGTMRLGAYPCHLAEGAWREEAYGCADISERHRHRYEFNREFEYILTEHGLRLTGQTPDGVYVEICEVPDHPWYLGLPVPSGVQIEAAGTSSAVSPLSWAPRWSIGKAEAFAAEAGADGSAGVFARAMS